MPGRALLRLSPGDWPEALCPGSLNVQIDRYPKAFEDRGLKNRIAELDRSLFKPEFEIPRNLLGNNQLGPRTGSARRRRASVARNTQHA